MTTRSFRIIPLALLGGCLSLICAMIAQADGYGFSPPSGWRAQHAPAGYTGLWVNPAGAEAVNLANVSASSLQGLVNQQIQKFHSLYPSMHIYSNAPYHVCGGHEARYLIWTAVSHGAQWIHEQVLAEWEGNGYVASYARPGSYAPNRAARASIVSVCGVAGGLNNPSAPQAPQAPQPAQSGSNPATAAPAAPASPTPYVYPSLYPRYAPVIPN